MSETNQQNDESTAISNSIPIANYTEQSKQWPQSGRHILSHHDDDTIVAYQAYCPEIGHFAAKNGYFGGPVFKYTRMSWIKPNFLWMMYRSDWGRSKGQEVILAIRLKRSFFDSLLEQAVFSSFEDSNISDKDEWKTAVGRSNVRLQWDPDHHPNGDKCERRAVQLGLRGEALEAFGKHEALEIVDVSDFVAEQRAHVNDLECASLTTPLERVYTPGSSEAAENVGLAKRLLV